MLLPLEIDGLTIAADGTASALRFTWKGRSNARDPGAFLVPYFLSALQTVADENGTIEMNFEAVEFFNSATIGALIYLVEEARQQRVPLVFVYDRRLKWQELNFEPLRILHRGDGLFRLRSS
jgi:hypothetical protein